MAKLRIYRLITTTLQACRSKDPSLLPNDPVPSFSPLHHLSSAFPRPPPPQFKEQHSDTDDDLIFAKPEKNPRRQKKKKRNVPSRLRYITSSADDMETHESSSPHSSTQLHPICFTTHRRSRRPKLSSKRAKRRAAEGETPARQSVFKKMMPCTVEGMVKESFAIVKRSEDPYEDFKSSMIEMIVEKQMSEHEDLEQLLHCFLSLNSKNYHGVIVQAFSEIWTDIFSPPESNAVGHYRRRRVSRIASSRRLFHLSVHIQH